MTAFQPARFQALRQGAYGQDLRCFDALASTQDAADEALRGGASEGTVVLAEAQSAGRGRWGKAWQSPPGQSLLLTVILKADAGVSAPGSLPLLLGLATAQGLAGLGAAGLGLKWPNDLWWRRRKLGGLLVEARHGHWLAGLGLNVRQTPEDFPPELREEAASLRQCGVVADREALLAALLSAWQTSIEAWRADGPSAWLDAWNGLDALKGLACRAQSPDGLLTGQVLGAEAGGGLRWRNDDGSTRVLQSAELSLLRPL